MLQAWCRSSQEIEREMKRTEKCEIGKINSQDGFPKTIREEMPRLARNEPGAI